jgi:hypothetical protein
MRESPMADPWTAALLPMGHQCHGGQVRKGLTHRAGEKQRTTALAFTENVKIAKSSGSPCVLTLVRPRDEP